MLTIISQIECHQFRCYMLWFTTLVYSLPNKWIGYIEYIVSYNSANFKNVEAINYLQRKILKRLLPAISVYGYVGGRQI